jgi:hypothetical protein
MSHPITHFHYVDKAGVVIRETGEKLAHREPAKLLKLRLF